MVKVISIEPTPNPDALKFVVDKPLLASGVRSFDDPASAQADSLAQSLFSADAAVQSVFYMDRFVTVRKSPRVEWDDLEPQLLSVIENAVPAEAPSPRQETASLGDDTLEKIRQIIDQNVRPALAGDGGGLEILDYTNNVLTVHYQGACGSCPSATMGTLVAIQNLLQRTVDPQIQVVSD